MILGKPGKAEKPKAICRIPPLRRECKGFFVLPLMGLSEYARHRGCRVNAVQVAILTGRIKRDAVGRIDSEQADRDWQENTPALSARPGPKAKPGEPPASFAAAKSVAVLEALSPDSSAGQTYMRARSDREFWSAKLRKIEVEEKQKTLVSRKEVEAEAYRAHRILRDACFTFRRAWPATGRREDAHLVHQVLEAELRQIFQSFAEAQAIPRPRRSTRSSTTAPGPTRTSRSVSGPTNTACRLRDLTRAGTLAHSRCLTSKTSWMTCRRRVRSSAWS